MAGEWAIVAAALGGAAVPSVMGLWLDKSKRKDDRELVQIDRRRQDELAVHAAAAQCRADYDLLCVNVARAVGRYHGIAMSQVTPNADDRAQLHSALVELSLRRGQAADYARRWLDDLERRETSPLTWATGFVDVVRAA